MSFNNTTPRVQSLTSGAIDFHCHGVGPFDFTNITELDLDAIEATLARRDHHSILSLYLPKANAPAFFTFMQNYAKAQAKGCYPHISGIAIEGPVLSSRGGTPKNSLWTPSRDDWKRFASCGKLGLVYMVLSPDAPNFETKETPLNWVVNTLFDGGVLPSPGHFSKSDPKASVESLQIIFDAAKARGITTITDHFLNDMPHNFTHAWRSASAKANRSSELEAMGIDKWNINTIEQTLGLIPACMIRNAHDGAVKICQNFDGEHVDLSILRSLLPIIGAKHLIMMTDSIESGVLAGQKLNMREDSTLLYEAEGIVAAGSQGVDQQIRNLISLGLSDIEINLITKSNPNFILNQHNIIIYDQAVGL